MIRKYTKQDHEQLMPFLLNEPSFNLFIIGDIENFGYDEDFQEIWVEQDEVGAIRAVLLRYYHHFVMSAPAEFDAAGFAGIIKQYEMDMLSGKKETIDHLLSTDAFYGARVRTMYFAELKTANQLDQSLDTTMVKRATVDDVERIFTLRTKIAEFPSTPNTKKSMEKTLKTGSGRTYFVEDPATGAILSSASTTAENSASAMIVGVQTDPDQREKGYASRVMNALCRDVLAEAKTLCLFYDNPKAGKIYLRLGFEEIGLWSMVDFS